MLYCESCRVRERWPKTVVRSYGPCDLCGEVQDCYDAPSHLLPALELPQE